MAFQVGRQVDDVDGVEGAFLRADTATDTETLGDEGDLAGRVDFDAEFASFDDRAGFLAFLAALLGFAFVGVDNGDTGSD